MHKTTTTTSQAPVNGVSSSESLDPEVLAFRANFEARQRPEQTSEISSAQSEV